MKLILREYLAALREREELDAILPDLLSELGYTVFSKPQRGTRQHGVDVGAVGDHNGERKVFLFTIKPGDLTRQDWEGGQQAVRPSLGEIEDIYIPNKVPPAYKDLKVVIVICVGGEVKETVRDLLTGYTKRNTTEKLCFEEWNGDVLATHLLEGVLREEVLPKAWRSDFQKAIALLDEPDTAYRHFAALLRQIAEASTDKDKERIRAARQIYLCLWILYIWARDLGNLEAPYRASELALLSVWELIKPDVGKTNATAAALTSVLLQLIEVHQAIASELLDKKIGAHASARHAVSAAVPSQNAIDINLKLFDLLGRIALLGLWHQWAAKFGDGEHAKKQNAAARQRFDTGVSLIAANPHLFLPVTDHQATDIALFLTLWMMSGGGRQGDIAAWLTDMVKRLNFTMRVRSTYPIVSSDYRDLIVHPKERSDEYFAQNTEASTLIPLLTAWLGAMGETEATDALAKLTTEKLPHCTMQTWLPDETSETHLYLNTEQHGRALADLDVTKPDELLDILNQAVRDKSNFSDLTAIATDNYPIVLMACRHWRLPVPANFWIDALRPEAKPEEAGDGSEATRKQPPNDIAGADLTTA